LIRLLRESAGLLVIAALVTEVVIALGGRW